MGWFRSWDRAKAGQVTRFVANSRAVAERIGRFYGREAQVVHPPVRTDFLTPAGERGETFLYVGSLVSYKRADLVVEAFRELPYRLTVVGEGHLGRALKAARRRKRHLPRRGGRRRATRALSRGAGARLPRERGLRDHDGGGAGVRHARDRARRGRRCRHRRARRDGLAAPRPKPPGATPGDPGGGGPRARNGCDPRARSGSRRHASGASSAKPSTR